MAESEPTNLTLFDVDGGTAWITLNDPARRNALSGRLMGELASHLRRAHADDAIRTVVVTGNGPAFCAGADLKSGGLAGASAEKRASLPDVLELIRDGDKPVIAAVNGAAFGGGLGLVAAADIAIGVDGTKMAFSEVRIGVIPAVISVVVVPKLGRHQAMRLFLTGERFTSEQAVNYGLLHRSVPASELRAAVQEELDAIHLGGPVAIREAKRLVRGVENLPPGVAFAETSKQSLALFASEEAAEGMAAFREKRLPSWAKPRD